MSAMWTSKLGTKFPRDQIDSLDSDHHRILKALRKQSANALCAECAHPDTSWASVSLGVFICIHCADIHRAVGTHISKVKGCSGTYLWGPDEIGRMQQLGNAEVRSQLGRLADECKPSADASKEERVTLCRRKYEGRTFCTEGRKQTSPAPQDQTAKAPRPATSLHVPTQALLAPVARKAPEPSLIDDLFKDFDFGEAPAPQPQQFFSVGAGADSKPLAKVERPTEVPQASTALSKSQLPLAAFDDFFRDFSKFAPVVKPPRQSEKMTSRPSTPDASTAASEADSVSLLERCLTPTPQSQAAMNRNIHASCSQPAIAQPAELAKIWDDFGEW